LNPCPLVIYPRLTFPSKVRYIYRGCKHELKEWTIMKKLMTVIGLALVMCLLASFSCAAPSAPMLAQAPAPGQHPKIIDEGIYAIPPEITDEGIFAIPPEITDEGIFARPDEGWDQWKWDKKNKKGGGGFEPPTP